MCTCGRIGFEEKGYLAMSRIRKPQAATGDKVSNYSSKPRQVGEIQSIDPLGKAKVKWADGSTTDEAVIFLQNDMGTLFGGWGEWS